MILFLAALWAEALKARRSKVPWLTALGFSLAPLVGGLFMIILKDPERARSMGLISAKAQLAAGVADWPTFFGLLAQATAVGGAMLFTIVTAWVFGREFSDHTAKELLALPTRGLDTIGTESSAKHIFHKLVSDISHWNAVAILRTPPHTCTRAVLCKTDLCPQALKHPQRYL